MADSAIQGTAQDRPRRQLQLIATIYVVWGMQRAAVYSHPSLLSSVHRGRSALPPDRGLTGADGVGSSALDLLTDLRASLELQPQSIWRC